MTKPGAAILFRRPAFVPCSGMRCQLTPSRQHFDALALPSVPLADKAGHDYHC